jgi:hypothetical protein
MVNKLDDFRIDFFSDLIFLFSTTNYSYSRRLKKVDLR